LATYIDVTVRRFGMADDANNYVPRPEPTPGSGWLAGLVIAVVLLLLLAGVVSVFSVRYYLAQEAAQQNRLRAIAAQQMQAKQRAIEEARKAASQDRAEPMSERREAETTP
jgi:hypothetical protein